MKTHKLIVTLEFSDDVDADEYSEDITESILDGVIDRVNGAGVAPEALNTFTTRISVRHERTGFASTAVFDNK